MAIPNKNKASKSTRIQLKDIALRSAISAVDFYGALSLAERQSLIQDLLSENTIETPYIGRNLLSEAVLSLTIGNDSMEWEIQDGGDQSICKASVSLEPVKQNIRDYLKICDSYAAALKEGGCSRLEAIDMGRRGLHNESAEILMSSLRPDLVLDFETSRRLFALICAIHRKN